MARQRDAFEVGILIVGGAAAVLALLVAGLFVNGLVIMQLFNWFAVPIFGVPTIGFWLAAGLGILANWFTYQDTTMLAKDKENKNAWAVLLFNNLLLRPAFALLLGWLIHGWAF